MWSQGSSTYLCDHPFNSPISGNSFSISKGLGFHHTEFIHNFLLKVTAGREDVVNNILSYINNTNAGKLGSMGVVTLLAVVVSLIGTIEDTLNSIFEIPKNRTLKEKNNQLFFHYPSIANANDCSGYLFFLTDQYPIY